MGKFIKAESTLWRCESRRRGGGERRGKGEGREQALKSEQGGLRWNCPWGVVFLYIYIFFLLTVVNREPNIYSVGVGSRVLLFLPHLLGGLPAMAPPFGPRVMGLLGALGPDRPLAFSKSRQQKKTKLDRMSPKTPLDQVA